MSADWLSTVIILAALTVCGVILIVVLDNAGAFDAITLRELLP